ncbi:MAG: cytochrome c oxidase assembly protein [Chloroflexi bacterium]|nr:MAG: cytochrome c oxidase assembly protein [Chloroflexota bacterium]
MLHDHPTDSGALLSLAPLLIIAGVLFAYLVAAKRQRRFPRRWSRWRILSMVSGIGLLAIAFSPPLATSAHHDLRGHMIQHLLIGMFAPLGLVFAAPVTLALRTLPLRTARFVPSVLHSWPCRWLSHPVPALLLNSGGMYLLYLTPLHAMSLTNPSLHYLVQIHFLAAGCLFTAAIAGPDPMPRRPGLATRLGVLFIGIAAHANLSKLMYIYLWPPNTSHSADEIRAAAQLMYYGGDLAELFLVVALFATWYQRRGAIYGKRRPQRQLAERM